MLSFEENIFLNIQQDARSFARRGLYAARHIEKNSVIGFEDLIPLRPTILDGGFLGSEVDLVIGKVSKEAIPQGEPFTRSNLE
jgi:sialic acid synthase SpsE